MGMPRETSAFGSGVSLAQQNANGHAFSNGGRLGHSRGGAGCSSHVSAAAERTSEPEAGSFPNVRSAADVDASGPDRLSRRLVWTQPFVMDRGPKNQGAWHRTCMQPGMRLVLSAPEERPYPPLVREQVFTRSSHRHASLRGIERGARSRPPLGGTVRLLLWMTRRSLREFLHLSHV